MCVCVCVKQYDVATQSLEKRKGDERTGVTSFTAAPCKADFALSTPARVPPVEVDKGVQGISVCDGGVNIISGCNDARDRRCIFSLSKEASFSSKYS